MEEEAARRFVAEQTRQLSQGGGASDPTDMGSDLQHKPTVHYAQSSEEQAMLREQVSDAGRDEVVEGIGGVDGGGRQEGRGGGGSWFGLQSWSPSL